MAPTRASTPPWIRSSSPIVRQSFPGPGISAFTQPAWRWAAAFWKQAGSATTPFVTACARPPRGKRELLRRAPARRLDRHEDRLHEVGRGVRDEQRVRDVAGREAVVRRRLLLRPRRLELDVRPREAAGIDRATL